MDKNNFELPELSFIAKLVFLNFHFYLCICICVFVFVFVFVYLYLYQIYIEMVVSIFWHCTYCRTTHFPILIKRKKKRDFVQNTLPLWNSGHIWICIILNLGNLLICQFLLCELCPNFWWFSIWGKVLRTRWSSGSDKNSPRRDGLADQDLFRSVSK